MTQELLQQIKEAGQDFEWYPTTRDMLAVIAKDIRARQQRRGLRSVDRIAELKKKIVHLMTERPCVSRRTCIAEEELLWRLFPEPKYPEGSIPKQIAQWREALEEWKRRAYGGDGIEYTETCMGQISEAMISLEKEGTVATVNCGYNVYVYYLLSGGKNDI